MSDTQVPGEATAERVLDSAARVVAWVTGSAIVLLMLLTVAEIIGRATGWIAIRGALEISELGLVIVVFAGMMVAEVAEEHVRTPLLVDRLPWFASAIVRLIGRVIAFVFLVWLTILTWGAALVSIERGEFRFGVLSVPLWPAKLAIPLGLAAFAAVIGIRIYFRLVRIIRARQRGEIPVGSTNSEV